MRKLEVPQMLLAFASIPARTNVHSDGLARGILRVAGLEARNYELRTTNCEL